MVDLTPAFWSLVAFAGPIPSMSSIEAMFFSSIDSLIFNDDNNTAGYIYCYKSLVSYYTTITGE
jgi:hypothetical protein